MLLALFLLIAGFAVLIKGADFLVSGASSVAKKFNISNLAIGLTVVAIGTSMPELVVSTYASLAIGMTFRSATLLGATTSTCCSSWGFPD